MSKVHPLLNALDGVSSIMAMLLYGSGLRLKECLRLCVKDIEVTRYDIRTVQDLWGRCDVKTTMIYTHVSNRGGRGVQSPADGLLARDPAGR